MTESEFSTDIAFLIKAMESRPDKKFAVLEGNSVGGRIVIIWRSADEKVPGEYYEIRVAEIKETAHFQVKK